MLDAILIGLVQGLTEFLPVSSSGHLVLFQHAIPGWEPPGVAFDLALHVGTLGSILVYYRRDFARLLLGTLRFERSTLRYVGLLAAGSVPTAAIGLGFRGYFEAAFARPQVVGGFLLITASFLVIAHHLARRASRDEPGLVDALVIGTFQGLAIMPGISRSGSTVTGALLRGVNPVEAARFSFLLSVPAVAGAALLMALEDGFAGMPAWPVSLAGVMVAFASGLAAISLFVRALTRGKFIWFAAYCSVVAVVAITVFSGNAA